MHLINDHRLRSALGVALWLFSSAQMFGAFVESDGFVVVEAENFVSQTTASGHAWIATNDVAGFVGTSAMCAVPNTGVSLNAVSSSPSLTYAVQLTNAGTFKVWIRAWAATGSDDSFYLGVDGSDAQSVSFSHTSAWVWKSVSVTIANAGTHQINLWMREDGAYVDRFLLTRSSSYTPTGDGPPESAPGINITYPLPGATFPAGSSVLVNAELKDEAGKIVRFQRGRGTTR